MNDQLQRASHHNHKYCRNKHHHHHQNLTNKDIHREQPAQESESRCPAGSLLSPGYNQGDDDDDGDVEEGEEDDGDDDDEEQDEDEDDNCRVHQSDTGRSF